MTLDQQQPDQTALTLSRIAIEAGQLLCDMENAVTDRRIKSDGTTTTSADLAAEQLIIRRLEEIWPDVPIVAEETANTAHPAEYFFLVDPLDGTSDFLGGTGEYTVNIALIQGVRPIAGVVAAPRLRRVWMAGDTVSTAEITGDAANLAWRLVHARPAHQEELVALVSRRHGDDATERCLATLSIGTRRAASSALKFCLIASGEADVYVRCGPTMEWDTAAGDHILTQAGGCVVGPGGDPLTYGHEERGFRNGPFAALGDAALAPRLALPLAATA